MRYTDGIRPEHVIASASVPLLYEPEKVDGEAFYDGGILSNTPLREVLHAHRNYWHKIRKQEEVPPLEVYIVSVWPRPGGSENNAAPEDFDRLKERLYDIELSDKTANDERNAVMVTDLVEMVDRVRSLALDILKDDKKKSDTFKSKYDGLLGDPAKSKNRKGDQRTYRELISGRVKLARDVIRIECRPDVNSISNKLFDLSEKTIDYLIERGRDDARKALDDAHQKKKKDKQ